MNQQVEPKQRTHPERWVPSLIRLVQERPDVADVGLGPVAEIFTTT